MGTYETRGRRSKKGNGTEGRPHFLEDKLIAALFVHHRDLVPRELEMRLLPLVIPQPHEKMRVWRRKQKPTVICLPDRSKGLMIEPRLPPKRKATIIIQDVCERHGITIARFMGDDRVQDVIAARREACYLMAKDTEMSIPAIGRFVKRDHSTVMNSIWKYCIHNKVAYPRKRQNEMV